MTQYENGADGRAAEIESTSDRSRDELLADLRDSGARLIDQISLLPMEFWNSATLAGYGNAPAADVLCLRWRELAVHSCDLDSGFGWRDWPEVFVATFTERDFASATKVQALADDDGISDPAHRLYLLYRGNLQDNRYPAW